MKTTLTLDDVTVYYPYKVSGVAVDEEGTPIFKGIVEGINFNEQYEPLITIKNGVGHPKVIPIKNLRLILRPTNDLIVPLQSNKNQKPMITLAEIEEREASVSRVCKYEIHDSNPQIFYNHHGNENEIVELCYFQHTKNFFKRSTKGGKKIRHTLNHPYELFCFLHQQHIDVRGLIDNELAYDVNKVDFSFLLYGANHLRV